MTAMNDYLATLDEGAPLDEQAYARWRDQRASIDAPAIDADTEEPEAEPAVVGTSRGRARVGESDRIIQLATELALFHTPAGEAYADLAAGGHRETWPIPSEGLAEYLNKRYWDTHSGAPREASVKDAMRAIAARARYASDEHEVHLRVGADRATGRVYLDLADPDWRVVEIGPTGWRIVTDESPVRFRRGSSALALPAPEGGGNLEGLLRPFLNLPEDESWRLCLAVAVHAMLPWGPYPPLVLGGTQDAGKSTTAQVLRALIDPDHAPLTTAPRDNEELLVTARNVWMPVYDNVSRLDADLSDGICRLSSGAGMPRRKRYSDNEVVTIKAQRPVIVTGIGDLATRGDLLSRSVILTLPPLSDRTRRTESAFFESLAEARPRMLGALCDLLVRVLAELPSVTLPTSPRMADFARLGVALERAAGWPSGSFLEAYEGNRKAGHETALEASLLVPYLEALAKSGGLDAPAADFLGGLNAIAGDAIHDRRWPKTPNVLSRELARIAPSVGQHDLRLERREVKGRAFWKLSEKGILAESSAPSAPSAPAAAQLSTDWGETRRPAGADVPPTGPWGAVVEGAQGADVPPTGPWGADVEGAQGADGADGGADGHRHPEHAQMTPTHGALHAQGADGADDSSLISQGRGEGEESDPELACDDDPPPGWRPGTTSEAWP